MLPPEVRGMLDDGMVDAVRAGADLDDLAMLARELIDRWKQQQPDPDEPDDGRPRGPPSSYSRFVRIDKFTIVVDDYDRAIDFYTKILGFELIEDSPSLTNDGRAKRWVVVRPPDGGTGVLLARADGERQEAAVGNQTGGRVGFFLEVDDFTAHYSRLVAAGVTFVNEPHTEPYGRVVVFTDPYGNKWDLIGPAPAED